MTVAVACATDTLGVDMAAVTQLDEAGETLTLVAAVAGETLTLVAAVDVPERILSRGQMPVADSPIAEHILRTGGARRRSRTCSPRRCSSL